MKPRSDTPARALPWRSLLPVLVLFAIVGFLSLGQRDLWAPDEPKYALAAREMLESQQFLQPHVNRSPYPDKPPLLFWSIALAAQITGGVGQPAAVLPSVLAGLVALLATARLTWILSERRDVLACLLGTAFLALTYRFVNQAVVGQIDMLLTAATTWAFALLVEGSGFAPGLPARRSKTIGAFAIMGLGVLAKGPIGLILPLGGLLLGAWLSGRRPPFRHAFDAWGWLAFAAVVLAWLGPAVVLALGGEGEAWLHDLLFRHTVVRFVDSWHHIEPFWFFLAVPWYDFMPVVLLLPPALWTLIRGRVGGERRPAMLLLAGACLFILVFFSIPQGKRGLYLLPAYPLASAWVALDLSERLRRGGRFLTGPRLAAGVLALLASAVGAWILVEAPDRLAEHGMAAPVLPTAGAILAMAVAGAAAALWARHFAELIAVVGVSWFFLYVSLVSVVFPAVDPQRSAKLFVEELEERVVADAQPGMVDFRAQFGFYAGAMQAAPPGDPAAIANIAERLAGDEPFWVVMKEEYRRLVERELPSGASPVEVLRRRISDDVYVVLATPEALRRGSGE